MKQLLALCLSLFFIACSGSHSHLHYSLTPPLSKTQKTYDLKTASYLDIKTMAEKLKNYSVVFMGDHHTEDDLHLKLTALIKALQKQGKRIILANEWFTPDQNPILNDFVTHKISKKDFLSKIQWEKRIGLPYESFEPMYKAVITAKGDLVGINLTKKQQQNISKKFLAQMNLSEKNFYHNLDLNVSIHKEMLRPYFEDCHAYSKSKEDCTQRMYRVQVAWDTKMAKEVFTLRQKLQENEMIIVLAGSLHLENGLGMNLRFARLSQKSSYTLIPRSDLSLEIPLGLADGIIFYKENQAEK